MRRIASFVFLLFSLTALHAQECDVSAVAISEPRYGTVGGQAVSAIAANENGAFGVWRQTHVGFAFVSHTVHGTPLDASGAPRVPAQQRYLQGTPFMDVATDGTDYLLAGAINGATLAKIIDASGADLTPTINVLSGPGAQGTVHAVWNGDAYAVLTTS